MRRLLKFLHTIGAIGLMGATASLILLITLSPPPASLAGYALMHGAMADIANWIYLPSLVLTILAGLLSIAAVPAFQNAGWAWAKLASAVLLFEGSMVSVMGPIREEAKRSAAALAGHFDAAMLAASSAGARNTLWALLAVMMANVALGVWRPRFVSIEE